MSAKAAIIAAFDVNVVCPLRILYTLLYIHLLPLIVLRLYWRSLKNPGYRRRVGERFARLPKRQGSQPLLWVHAVSVGEVIAATPLVKRLMQQHPDWQVCITTTTPTGSERVRAAFDDTVLHYYLPYDLPSLVSMFIRAIRPAALIIMETELWPNLLATCRFHRLPVMLANGRMSARSARGYRRVAGLTRPMLQQLDLVAAQSATDGDRFVQLGVDPARVLVTGSIKFDVQIDEQVQHRALVLKAQLQSAARRCVVFASTHPGEDEVILPMIRRLQQLYPSLLAVVVPRHPERFAVVSQLAARLQLPYVLLSSDEVANADTRLVIGDTMGDVLALYGIADLAFVGGSLVNHGGHNMLEAAAWGVPIVTGPFVFNFQAISEALQVEGGLTTVMDRYDLERTLERWLDGSLSLEASGQAARAVLAANQGALDRLLAGLLPLLPQD